MKELLRGLVDGIAGVVGATVVGMDGNMIEAPKVSQNFPLEEIAQAGTLVRKILDYMCHRLDGVR